MLELIPNVPDNVLAVTATGKVTKEDYEEVIFPALEKKAKDHSKLRLLYHVSPEYTGITGGGLYEDDKVGRKYFFSFEKIAVVTGKNSIRNAIKAFGWMMPGEKKIFGAAELDDALAWIVD